MGPNPFPSASLEMLIQASPPTGKTVGLCPLSPREFLKNSTKASIHGNYFINRQTKSFTLTPSEEMLQSPRFMLLGGLRYDPHDAAIL